MSVINVEVLKIDREGGKLTLQCHSNINIPEFKNEGFNGRIFGYFEPYKPNSTTDEQRKHFYALCRDISEHTGLSEGRVKINMKALYMVEHDKDKEPSLARNKMHKDEARKLIQTVINFALDENIPLNGDYHPYFEEQQFFRMIMKRQCFVCGKHGADIHHQEHLVGMGRDRRKIDHTKSKFFALCRSCHTKAHQEGLDTFKDKHKLIAITLNEDQLKRLGVM